MEGVALDLDHPVVGEAHLAVGGPEVEDDGGCLEAGVGHGGLVAGLEGVEPCKVGHGYDVIVEGGEGEAGTDGGKGTEVGLQDVGAVGEGG